MVERLHGKAMYDSIHKIISQLERMDRSDIAILVNNDLEFMTIDGLTAMAALYLEVGKPTRLQCDAVISKYREQRQCPT